MPGRIDRIGASADFAGAAASRIDAANEVT